MRHLLLALVVVLALAVGASADRVVTYFTLTLTDVQSVCFERTANAPNGWAARAHALVRSSGTPTSTSAFGPVTAGQKTAIETYITTHVLPALNTQEGL